VAREGVHGRKPAVALHEGDAHVLGEPGVEAGLEGAEVVVDDGREVGVDAGGEAAGHHLDHGHDARGEGDLGEADLGGHAPHHLLVLREGVGVEQHDGDAAEALLLVVVVVVVGVWEIGT
jgi:hypothetical protein